VDKEVTFEIECPKCYGRKKVDNKICENCNGKGTVLTEDGKKILAFLKDSIRMSEH
jgi:DnaJ-class molecular chaperone